MNDIIKSKSCCSTTRNTISSRKRTRRNTNCCIGNRHNKSISISILFAVLVRVVVILSIIACCCNISTNRTRTTTLSVFVMGYHHNTCTSDRAKQFQFADCYIPNLADDLLLKDASFVMSHDSGTGYLQTNQQGVMTTINGAIINLYTKNQLGTVYQQLDDGARALDVRPKLLTNGTIILHHGAVPIGVALETLVSDAIRWSNDNPNELVLILHSNLVYPTISSSSSSSSSGQYNNNDDENDNDNDNDNDDYNDAIVPSADTAVTALSQVYDNLGVTYVQCSDLYELTVGEAKELSALSSSSSSSSSGGGGGEKKDIY